MLKLFAPNVADVYKVGHVNMYQEQLEFLCSNMTPRTDKYFGARSEHYDNTMVVWGIQGLVKELLIELWNETFFDQPKDKVIKRYARRMKGILGFDLAVAHMENLWELGFMPIEIKALPEGSRVGMKVPVLTIRNTLPGFGWLVNYLETAISNMLWKMMTVATIAAEYRRTFEHYATMTGCTGDLRMAIAIQGHDFSYRGVGGPEDGARSNSGHLLSFIGTDTPPAIDYLEDYYGADEQVMGDEPIGVSVPATEHSVSSTNIMFIMRKLEEEGEYKGTKVGSFDFDNRQLAEYCFLKELITEKYPSGIVSYVADTYDYFFVVNRILPLLKDEIENRQPDALGMAKVVIRPDSGNPQKILCGTLPRYYGTPISDIMSDIALNGWMLINEDTPQGIHTVTRRFFVDGVCYEAKFTVCVDRGLFSGDAIPSSVSHNATAEVVEPSWEEQGTFDSLYKTFGGTKTETGHILLNPSIGVIYGDSITVQTQNSILKQMMEDGYASINVVFGVGSYSYQYMTRDTFGTAMKATHCTIDGEDIEVYKDPATGDKMKKSARGLLRVELEDGKYVLYDQQTEEQSDQGELRTVFMNGQIQNEETLPTIRRRLEQWSF